MVSSERRTGFVRAAYLLTLEQQGYLRGLANSRAMEEGGRPDASAALRALIDRAMAASDSDHASAGLPNGSKVAKKRNNRKKGARKS